MCTAGYYGYSPGPPTASTYTCVCGVLRVLAGPAYRQLGVDGLDVVERAALVHLEQVEPHSCVAGYSGYSQGYSQGAPRGSRTLVHLQLLTLLTLLTL
jgi:hypothetical protein